MPLALHRRAVSVVHGHVLRLAVAPLARDPASPMIVCLEVTAVVVSIIYTPPNPPPLFPLFLVWSFDLLLQFRLLQFSLVLAPFYH